MRTIAVGMLLLALPVTAAAQPGMTPYAQPPAPATGPAAQPEPKARLELSLGAASPKGDWETTVPAETSPSFGLQLGVNVASNISVFGGFRLVRVKFDERSADAGIPEDFEMSHRELQLGLRFTSPMSATAKLFVEGNVNSSTLAYEYQGESDSISGVGLGVRGGLIFMIDRKIGIGAAVSYTSAGIEPEGDERGETFDDTWLGFDGNLSIWF